MSQVTMVKWLLLSLSLAVSVASSSSASATRIPVVSRLSKTQPVPSHHGKISTSFGPRRRSPSRRWQPWSRAPPRGGSCQEDDWPSTRAPPAPSPPPRTMSAAQMQVLNFLSGGVAGTIASCLTNPLEVIKAQLQSSIASAAAHGELAAAGGHPVTIARRILEKDGPTGFLRGLKPTLVGIIPARSAYFYTYEKMKRGIASLPSPLTNLRLPEGSVGNALLSGLAAGIAGNTLTNPIWMVKTRMQLMADGSAGQRTYANYGDVISSIAREEGLGGFYKGITASYWGCAEGAIQFVLYEKIKSRLLDRRNLRRAREGLSPTEKLPEVTYFLSAAVAKCVAAILTYPHEVARTRMREQARSGVFKYNGMWPTLTLIAKEEGRKGLYAGMGMHLIKVVPNSAIMFLTYELVNAWLDQFKVVD